MCVSLLPGVGTRERCKPLHLHVTKVSWQVLVSRFRHARCVCPGLRCRAVGSAACPTKVPCRVESGLDIGRVESKDRSE